MTFWQFILSLIKLAIISMVVGAGLTYFNLSAADLLASIGLTPEKVAEALTRGFQWALPNVMLGSMVVVPLWLVMMLFRPPRG
jgi:hypothetical protein